MKQEQAETLAVQALGWIAASDDLMPVFMGATGISIDDIRARASEPEFLASVLDFLLMDDAWITGFCDTAGQPYDAVMRARAALPGGQQMHWT
ncbi:MAG: hypothetical protein CMH12_16920 [Maritimibacter sp.]|nr:hypothetical protein [Maritimibacter sp.]MAS53109.1 hypothetical protein [Pimelobacter sp.]